MLCGSTLEIATFVTKHKHAGWLEEVLVGARDARWCTRPFCTTCGCLKFRQAYWSAAVRRAGIAGNFDSARTPSDFLADVSNAERHAVVQTLVAGLRELSPMWAESEAFRVIVIDLEPPFFRHGVPMILDEALSGSPAADALRRMRAHDAEVRAQYERRLANESPAAAEERKRTRRAERAAAHARRQQETARRNRERLAMLGSLAQLSPVDRLKHFATDHRINLDGVPTELIPTQQGILLEMQESLVAKLLARIGRRRGAWGRLRLMLEGRVNHGRE
jgi:hypothetical protein